MHSQIEHILTIHVVDEHRDHPNGQTYFFEYRDLHFLVRYLMELANPEKRSIVLDVRIHRTHVAGLCSPGTAASKLFMLGAIQLYTEFLATTKP